MSNNDGIIFDMDGVLVDTYHAHYRSWMAVAEAEGFPFSEEEFARTFGQTSREIIAGCWGAKGTVPFSLRENRDSPPVTRPSAKGTVPFSLRENRDSPPVTRPSPKGTVPFSLRENRDSPPVTRPSAKGTVPFLLRENWDSPPVARSPLSDEEIAALDDRKEAVFREILSEDFPAMPGVHELLAGLHRAGFKLAVGSSGPPENVALVVERLPGGSLFSATVDGMDVTRGKPDPQVFLIAAERLGVPPDRCAVVEDAPVGVQAAHAAGMAAVALLSTGRTRESLADADLVVESLGELSPERIRALLARRGGKRGRG